MRRVLAVFGPSGRIIPDVLADPVEFRFISDDVIVVVALPEAGAG
jgi:hypothetical protein